MNEITVSNGALSALEQYIRVGDLGKLTPEQRVSLYNGICESLGLNPLTRPFEFITLNGKLTLYAKKDCAEQLRRIHSISIRELDVKVENDLIVAKAVAVAPDGRIDHDYGVVPISGKGADFANAYLKAITKAKRRVTLSICGLAFLDESELDTVPDVKFPALEETSKVSLQDFSKQSVALASFLFDSDTYNASYKARILKLTGLGNKKLNQFTEQDMETYLAGMVRFWLQETLRLSDDEVENNLRSIRNRYPSLLHADMDSLKEELSRLFDVEYEEVEQ